MKTVFVLFDSLNRLALGSYGGTSVATPNFDRFARKSVTFDKHYDGSLRYTRELISEGRAHSSRTH